eukprot:Lithocolla_globosa_v1_NODE_897_length_3115_cov_8.205229.p3 type:complete len:123 gc:universal NODE_897_length_3115_cov_8.205229:756-1124(+)
MFEVTLEAFFHFSQTVSLTKSQNGILDATSYNDRTRVVPILDRHGRNEEKGKGMVKWTFSLLAEKAYGNQSESVLGECVSVFGGVSSDGVFGGDGALCWALGFVGDSISLALRFFLPRTVFS